VSEEQAGQTEEPQLRDEDLGVVDLQPDEAEELKGGSSVPPPLHPPPAPPVPIPYPSTP